MKKLNEYTNMILRKIKIFLLKNFFIRNLYTLSNPGLDMIYNKEDLNEDYYTKIKERDDRETEHQIGRIINYRKILSEINRNKLPGDIIEFGSWKGFSLLWIAHLAERAGLFTKKIVAIDSFLGLPNDEGIFKKGHFKNTSFQKCYSNIKYSKDLYPITKKNIYIKKFLFSQKDAILEMLTKIPTQKFCFIHIDCDISSSINEIFCILREGDLLNDTCYLLFDDYGVIDSYKNTVDSLLKTLENQWTIEEHSSTNLTKNFLLKKI